MFTLGEIKFLVVTTPALREAVHRLRYKVYVEEYGFEKPADHPSGMEKDRFDESAILFAAVDSLGRVLGTSRLILNGPLGLPALDLAAGFYQDPNPASRKIVEVSRLALDPSLRGSVVDSLSDVEFYIAKALGEPRGAGEPMEGWQKRVVILLGLIQAMYQVGQALAVTDYYVVAERSLWVLLRRHKINFRPLGPPIEHHGLREVFRGFDWEIGPPILAFQHRVSKALGLEELKPPAARDERLGQGEEFSFGGFHFSIARSDGDLAALYALRAELDRVVPPPEADKVQNTYLQRDGKDNFDSHAVHLVAKDQEGRVVGTIRVVLNSAAGLPCKVFFHPDYEDGYSNSKKVAELGRFALAQPYLAAFFDIVARARLASDDRYLETNPDKASRRNRARATIIFMGLLRLSYRVSKHLRLTKLHLMMEVGVARFFARRGIYSHQVGDPSKLKGHGAPYAVAFHEIEPALLDFRAVRAVLRDLVSTSSVKEKFDPMGLSPLEDKWKSGKN